MKKNLNRYGLKGPAGTIHKLFLFMKITGMILMFGFFDLPATPAYYLNDDEQQKLTVSGKVTDSKTGEALPGVNIVVKDVTLGTNTDMDGKYSIAVPDRDAVLVFSFIGYTNLEMPVAGKTVIDVALVSQLQNLDEIVVTAYGTQKKNTLTGSVSMVKGNVISKIPVPNISNSIAGNVAGVTMRPNGGQPGYDNPEIFIRGIGTTGDNNSPLIIIDGFRRNNISQLDPSSIESISVLKDAAAVAPYGLGGANGVILITTKKGVTGAPTLTFNTYYGWQTPTYYPDLLNAKDYMKLKNEAYLNANPGSPDAELPFLPSMVNDYDNLHAQDPDRYPNSTARDLVNMVAPVQNYNMQITGGTEKMKYFAGIGYFKQEGLFDQVNYSRFNYNINLESKVTKTTTVSLSVISSMERRNDLDPSEDAVHMFRSAYKYLPIHNLYYTNGLWGQSSGNAPAAVLNAGGWDKRDLNTVLSSLSIEQQLSFVKGLSIKGAVSYDSNSGFQKGWHTPWYYWVQDLSTTPYSYDRRINPKEGGDAPAYTYLTQQNSRGQAITLQGYVNYQRTFGKHDITGLFVAEGRETQGSFINARRNNYVVSIDEINMGSSDKNDFDNGGSSEIGTQIGYVYRLGYVYNNKYMAEASGRYDGHYYFAPGLKWGYFPAFSLGWRLSEENFMKNITFINNLKIRGSWGKSGNLAGDPYQYLSGYNLVGSQYAFGSGTMVPIAYSPQEANPNITWEISTKTDVGFEATLWNSLLTVEADYFFEHRTGMLLPPAITVPQEYGLPLADENAGEMENNGIELTVGSRRELANGLKLGFIGNFSYAKNKMVQVYETSATYDNPNRRRTGRPYLTPFGYKSLGLFSTADDKNNDGVINSEDGYNITQFGELHPGDIRYADLRGQNGDLTPDRVIDQNDEVSIGYPIYPEMSYGFTPTAEWKGFDLSLFFQGSARASLRTFGFQTVCFRNDNSDTDYEYLNNHWTQDHQDAKYPRADLGPTANNGNDLETDFWMKNTNFLRLKTLTFGYTLPKSVLNSLKISNIRAYCSGQNLLTFSNLKYMDPETGAYDDVGTSYPLMKSFTFGLNVTF
jgi:TonB-linked SusC/RagA family outer membrane protein